MDAIAAAQALSEIGYLLRQDPKEVYRARAFSAAAWALALERPDLEALHKANQLTAIEGVGAGIAKVLAGLVETGTSSYLERLRAETGQPARDDESTIDLGDYQGDLHSHTDWSDGRATMLEMARAAKALGYNYLGGRAGSSGRGAGAARRRGRLTPREAAPGSRRDDRAHAARGIESERRHHRPPDRPQTRLARARELRLRAGLSRGRA